MDKFILRLGDSPRLHRFPLKLNNIAYISSNFHNRKSYFESIDFGFELSGEAPEAVFAADGKIYKSPYPCVTAVKPGVCYEMLTEKPWELLYFTYSGPLLETFKQFNIDFSRPLWGFQMTSRISRCMKMIFDICENIHEHGAIDMLDRLCEQLISATIVNNLTGTKATDPLEIAVRKAASYIELNYKENICLHELIARQGISQASFLRCWNRIFKLPPSRYITKMKIDEAAYLLTGTALRINEIADQLNFDDPLYFSRKFKNETGLSPKEYRKEKKSDFPAGLQRISDTGK